MKTKVYTVFIGVLTLLVLASCSYVKEAFPDKSRDYLNTGQIPPLKMPAGLGEGSPLSAAVASNSTAPAATDPVENPAASTAVSETPATEAPSEQEKIDPTLITVELTKTKNGEDSIFIDAPFVKSWRMVNKALSHLSVEVTERNSQESLFTVQYNPDEKKVEDSTYWDEIVFMFTGFVGGETELGLKLVENNSQTSVIVVDADQHPLSNELTQKLLNSLQKAIKDGLAQQ